MGGINWQSTAALSSKYRYEFAVFPLLRMSKWLLGKFADITNNVLANGGYKVEVICNIALANGGYNCSDYPRCYVSVFQDLALANGCYQFAVYLLANGCYQSAVYLLAKGCFLVAAYPLPVSASEISQFFFAILFSQMVLSICNFRGTFLEKVDINWQFTCYPVLANGGSQLAALHNDVLPNGCY